MIDDSFLLLLNAPRRGRRLRAARRGVRRRSGVVELDTHRVPGALRETTTQEAETLAGGGRRGVAGRSLVVLRREE